MEGSRRKGKKEEEAEEKEERARMVSTSPAEEGGVMS